MCQQSVPTFCGSKDSHSANVAASQMHVVLSRMQILLAAYLDVTWICITGESDKAKQHGTVMQQ